MPPLDTAIAIVKTRLKLLMRRGVGLTYSQFGEDAILAALFRGTSHGYYVDVGAYHPVLYSNTYALYTRGWHGLVIDPNASMKHLFTALRPRDTFVANAIDAREGTLTYYSYPDGAYNSLSRENVIAREQERGIRPTRSSEVPVRPLAAILREQGVTHIDFMNIDAEGMDGVVLSSNDWTAYSPQIIAVEDHSFEPAQPHESDIFRFLAERGYELTAFVRPTLIFRRGRPVRSP